MLAAAVLAAEPQIRCFRLCADACLARYLLRVSSKLAMLQCTGITVPEIAPTSCDSTARRPMGHESQKKTSQIELQNHEKRTKFFETMEIFPHCPR